MNDERFNYKANEINENDERNRIRNLCNEYCFNLGSSRKRNDDIFEVALKLKHFNNEQ